MQVPSQQMILVSMTAPTNGANFVVAFLPELGSQRSWLA
jgi:hypothetical protein